MADQTPTVMVSSTCYDLSQVRANISNFLRDDLGYNPLLSEYSTFPIDPDSNTVENCKSRVEVQADILVLVIGGRYGSIDKDSDKSITNIEYQYARAKGIPVYAFVDKRVEAQLPIWRDNPEVNFSSVVDTSRLFEFVQTVRDEHRVWVQSFENAQDIIKALRIQFAYLQTRGLKWFQRLRDSEEHRLASSLRGKPLRIFLERPNDWEWRLLSYTIQDGLDNLRDKRREHELAIALGECEFVPDAELIDWGHTRIHERNNLVRTFNILIKNTLEKAFGDAGQAGNAEMIIFAARNLVALYEQSIVWAARIRRTEFETPMDDLAMEKGLDSFMQTIESVPKMFLDGLERALMSDDPENFEVNLEFKLDADLDAIHDAMLRVSKKV